MDMIVNREAQLFKVGRPDAYIVAAGVPVVESTDAHQHQRVQRPRSPRNLKVRRQFRKTALQGGDADAR